ncbi:hypothetical protein CLOSTASPAR_05503 [[Clostridium] asparagiforme DSM 15981]|uniref:Uncharacterized protein n=1 Tax=[Clostridium] asparagiforme DSM 15981 TaxID=518636 RepID=C0D8A5_9FIRM|nr:hypothetical protein CLOSTASPAR_05503 [[Clostridium] asparagiforme DSM 15981]
MLRPGAVCVDGAFGACYNNWNRRETRASDAVRGGEEAQPWRMR